MMRLLLLIAVLLGSANAEASSPKAEPLPSKVGVAHRSIKPALQRNWRGASKQELDCTVWYPAADDAQETQQVLGPPDDPLFLLGKAAPNASFESGGGPRPLILLSHGTGGSADQMAWLGISLARAGMIAVAVNHPGNNATEKYTPEGFMLWWERATDLSNVLDAMLGDDEFSPHIDRKRIGAAGFSLGGYTVLELAGARTDISVMIDHCRAQPDAAECRVPEMKGMATGADMLRVVRKSSGESLARSGESYADPRVRAVFALAPALTATQTEESLHSIRIPVEVVVGAADPIAPAAENADRVRADVRGSHEIVLPGVAHYTFLSVCTKAGKQSLASFCTDDPGVEREAVHTKAADVAVDFFVHALKWK